MSSFNPSESTPSQQGCTDQSSVGSGSTDNLLRDQRGSQLGYSLALHSAAEGTPHPRSLARGGGDLSVYDPALIPDMPGLEPSRTPDFRGSVQPPADAQHESLTPFDGDSGFDDWVNWTGEQNEVQYQTGTPFNIADLALNQTTPGFYTDDFDDAAAAAINSIEPSGQPYATPDLQQHAFSPNARQVAQRNTPVSPTAFVAPPQRAPRRYGLPNCGRSSS